MYQNYDASAGFLAVIHIQLQVFWPQNLPIMAAHPWFDPIQECSSAGIDWLRICQILL